VSFLREIQESAINSKIDLATLLRKCKVLAARLGNPEFKNWVENELNGYKDKNEVPSYRKFNVYSKGHFFGPFQSGIKFADIPMACIPEEFREKLSHCWLLESVAALEALVSDSKGGTLQEQWSPDLVAHVGQDIYQDFNCAQAWKVIPKTAIIAAIDAVRNKILNFVLEIETENPDAGEAAIKANPVPQEKVQHIFNTYVTGSVQNLATGSSNFSQEAVNNPEHNKLFEELLAAVKNTPAENSLIQKVSVSIEDMQKNQNNPSFKDRYCSFMAILSDHMQVLGPVVAPYLPALLTLLK